jgi:hypothetical protein
METDHLASNNHYNASFANLSRVINGHVPFGHSYTVRGWNDTNGNEVEEYWLIKGAGHAGAVTISPSTAT